MGTVSGANTRRYHGHLVAATKAPDRRHLALANIEASATVGDKTYGVSTNQYVGAIHPQGHRLISQFSTGNSVRWTFDLERASLSKEIFLHPGSNTVSIRYTVESGEPVSLSLRPLVAHKFYHENFRFADFYPESLEFKEDAIILTHSGIELRLAHPGAERIATTGWYYRFDHQMERERGLDPLDDFFCPGELNYSLEAGMSAIIVASTDGIQSPAFPNEQSTPSDSSESLAIEAKRFIVDVPERAGIIAGYPWFTDWGRDTMISLPGICLETGEINIARKIIRSYASQMRRGLIPNRFVDTGETPDYNTVDATLWFANATYLTLETEWDQSFAEEALTWLLEIYEWHKKGTDFGIHVDPADGLLAQGEPGVQLTWMDAKVGDWVVTPRHGKPVEVNGLWINFLQILAWLSEKLGVDSSNQYRSEAESSTESMQRKFWHPVIGHYLDTVDPDDASLRPNQVIAMALPFAPLVGDSARAALDKVESLLLTPYGLRTLSPLNPQYRGRFTGNLAERDACYHQGTSWPWLLGSYALAVLKLTGDKERARASLQPIMQTLESYGLGGIAEVFDGDPPHNPDGCPWQAWSIAEVLRAWNACQ